MKEGKETRTRVESAVFHEEETQANDKVPGLREPPAESIQEREEGALHATSQGVGPRGGEKETAWGEEDLRQKREKRSAFEEKESRIRRVGKRAPGC